mgnify:CR=1 FL=1
MSLEITARDDSFILRLRVAPKAARTRISGVYGGALKLSVTEVPERGRATAAVLALLAEQLGLPKRCVRVVSGETSQDKIVAISGFSGDAAALERALLKAN